MLSACHAGSQLVETFNDPLLGVIPNHMNLSHKLEPCGSCSWTQCWPNRAERTKKVSQGPLISSVRLWDIFVL